MQAAQENTAVMHSTRKSACEEESDTLDTDAVSNTGKAVATLKAQFALSGHALEVQHRAGRTLYNVSRCGQSRTFTHLHDVEAFRRQLGGAL
ncbi:hypothetical protein D3C87_782530 [compost metagenome]